METEAVDDAMKERVDLLAKLFKQRLANHKSKKVDANKQSHFMLGWFSYNVSCVTAIVVIARHLRNKPDKTNLILWTEMLTCCSIQLREWITSL